MHIHQVTVATRSIDETASCYRDLGFPTVTEDDVVRVTVGGSEVVFRQVEGMTGAHHLAFTVPTGSFARARAWIASRAALLDREGVDEFEGPDGWDSRSVYVEGPDRQLLELIERRALPQRPFRGAEDLTLSEVGVAVPDVLGAVDRLRAVGVEPYAGEPTADFTPVGDVDGLLVLVSPGRRWYPVLDREPSSAPLEVRVGLDVPVELAAGVLVT